MWILQNLIEYVGLVADKNCRNHIQCGHDQDILIAIRIDDDYGSASADSCCEVFEAYLCLSLIFPEAEVTDIVPTTPDFVDSRCKNETIERAST